MQVCTATYICVAHSCLVERLNVVLCVCVYVLPSTDVWTRACCLRIALAPPGHASCLECFGARAGLCASVAAERRANSEAVPLLDIRFARMLPASVPHPWRSEEGLE